MSTVIAKHVSDPGDTMIVPHHMAAAVGGLEEGSVLMSVGGNVILRLNEVGTLIWQVLEEGRSKGGLELGEVLDGLFRLLEGCLTEPVSQKRVEADVLSFLNTLLQKKLIETIDKSDAKSLYLVSSGIFWSKKKVTPSLSTTSADERSNGTYDGDLAAQHVAANAPGSMLGQRPGSYNKQRNTGLATSEETFGKTHPSSSSRKIHVLTALLGLVLFDLLTKIYRFDEVHRIIERQSRRSRKKQVGISTLEDCKRICKAVDQAQIYYYKQIFCLQRSAVAACLLWLWGIPAELIIAARMIPFQSHAWVEVDGEVVNDQPSVRDRYDCVIERIGVKQTD